MRHLPVEGQQKFKKKKKISTATVQLANVLHGVHFLFALQIKIQHMLFN